MLLPCMQQGSPGPQGPVRSSVLMELCHPAEQGRGEQPPLPLGRLSLGRELQPPVPHTGVSRETSHLFP